MKRVSAELVNKLQKQYWGNALNTVPKVEVIAKQASMNTLITEVIHSEAPEGFGDVAICQLPRDAEPSAAFAICIDSSGTGNIYTRELPARSEVKWRFLWSIGKVKAVAIEFDGVWQMNAAKRYYELITEELPYIFYADMSGELYVQKWNDNETRVHLASGVSDISACRGWHSSFDIAADQGLIIGYLKNGSVFYRAYCQQGTGAYIWEPENVITELGTDNVSLSVYRTNDFRVGFLTENAGEMRTVLSERTYAGQACPPEYAETRVQNARLWLDAAEKHNLIMREYINTHINSPFLACYNAAPPALSIIATERDGSRRIILTFNYPVYGVPNAVERYIVSAPMIGIAGCEWVNDNQLIINLSQDLARGTTLLVTIRECHEAWFRISGYYCPIETISIEIPGEPIIAEQGNESINAVVSNARIYLQGKRDVYTNTPNECIIADLDCSVELPPIGVLPI